VSENTANDRRTRACKLCRGMTGAHGRVTCVVRAPLHFCSPPPTPAPRRAAAMAAPGETPESMTLAAPDETLKPAAAAAPDETPEHTAHIQLKKTYQYNDLTYYSETSKGVAGRVFGALWSELCLLLFAAYEIQCDIKTPDYADDFLAYVDDTHKNGSYTFSQLPNDSSAPVRAFIMNDPEGVYFVLSHPLWETRKQAFSSPLPYYRFQAIVDRLVHFARGGAISACVTVKRLNQFLEKCNKADLPLPLNKGRARVSCRDPSSNTRKEANRGYFPLDAFTLSVNDVHVFVRTAAFLKFFVSEHAIETQDRLVVVSGRNPFLEETVVFDVDAKSFERFMSTSENAAENTVSDEEYAANRAEFMRLCNTYCVANERSSRRLLQFGVPVKPSKLTVPVRVSCCVGEVHVSTFYVPLYSLAVYLLNRAALVDPAPKRAIFKGGYPLLEEGCACVDVDVESLSAFMEARESPTGKEPSVEECHKVHLELVEKFHAAL
jgi:hypothetical protein